MPVIDMTPEDTSYIPDNTNLLEPDSDKDIKTVSIDGPLSYIYSQALNIVYAKESAADGSMVAADTIQYLDDEGVDPDLYIYVTDDENLETDTGELRIALDAHAKSKRIVVIESLNMNEKISALECMAVANANKVFYRRRIAIENILAMLGRK